MTEKLSTIKKILEIKIISKYKGIPMRIIFRNKLSLTTVCLVALMVAGCSTNRSIYGGADKPALLNAKHLSHFNYTDPKDPNYYRNAYDKTGASEADRQSARNAVLADLKSMIDYNYHEFEGNLRGDETVKNTAADIAALGLTAAATAAGGNEVKTILSAIATGVVGVNTALDKNVFQNNTIQVLQLEMRALRAQKAELISKGMGGSTQTYPLETGISDVVDYYYAGSLTDALIGLSSSAGNQSQTSQDAAKKAAADLIKK